MSDSMKDSGEMSVTDKYALLSKDETVAGLKAKIEQLRAALQEIRQLNNHVDHPIIEKIARRALEGE